MSDFRKGDRVRMTSYGVRNFPRMRSYTGVVVATPRGGRFHVRVLGDGYKRPATWHPSFWEKDDAGK